ncbi:indole-3-glycerol phosphate synthase TrpC [Balneolaceae bacterium YR4-1]|uniref:Indole-3-glycerol phosphate synthase n=1 Tax=Halalkalibaculum roseum TaxID=2709311 RepID=A0A6M1T2J0_9BACT|nr:indole-3-glycerol phosphate synthase TrpC [Halalkalibaculum roseum]NGP76235.1 indole-3-glycerol phosphate synthase TrpC [Halalkalibaculum roseum]
MATILEQIVEQTATDLVKRKRKVSFMDFESFEWYERPRRPFGDNLRNKGTVSVIAEIKKASPSKGIIRKDFNPQKIASQYFEGGASALSVLTDEPAFQGSLDYLSAASTEVDIPVLRKDFIIDPYQVKEARAYGADAVLLIATITEGNQLNELLHASTEYGLECLVECYSEDDLNRLNFEYINILGVNNRDLKTFDVDLHRGIELLNRAPEETVLVSESGLSSAGDLKFLYDNNIDAALIGEYFMRQPDPGKAVEKMLGELKQLVEENAVVTEDQESEKNMS